MDVILNPKFTFRNDLNRILLIDRDGGSLFSGIAAFVHPHHAMFLSYFNGKHSWQNTITLISAQMSIDISAVERLAGCFMQKGNRILLKYEGKVFVLPGEILIENRSGMIRNDISPDKCICILPYKFDSLRVSFPLDVLLIPGMSCYTDCVYCYADKKHNYSALNTSRWLEIIDECKSIGTIHVDVSGGEFLLCPDWKLILKKLLSVGYEPEISTKLPLSNTTIDYLVDIGVTTIQFSLDTLVDHIAHKTLNTPLGYIDRIVKSINYADQVGLKTIIK